MTELDALKKWLNELQFPVTDIPLNSKIFRFQRNGKREKNAWFIGSVSYTTSGKEFLSATVGDWATGEKYSYKNDSQYSKDELREIEQRAKEQQKIIEAEKKELQKQAAYRAREMWEDAEAGPSDYCKAKGISSQQTKTYPIDNAEVTLIPMYSVDTKTRKTTIWGLQRIFQDKEGKFQKRFLTGQKTKELFFCFGQEKTESPEVSKIYLCEGFATGASLWQVTGCPVFVCFSSGNLLPVGKIVREMFQEAQIIFAADNDRFGEKNVGVESAEKAAHECDGVCVFPTFDESDEGSKGLTDWNDLHVRKGEEGVRRQIEGKLTLVADNPITQKISETKAPEKNRKVGEINFPDISPKGRALNTINNLDKLLSTYGVTLRYNCMTRRKEIFFPGKNYSTDNQANSLLSEIKSLCSLHGMPADRVPEYTEALADRTQYHPVREWIESVPWDGESRLQDLYDTIESDTKLKNTLIRKWLLSAVAALYEKNGVAACGVLTLQGEQGGGKTRWFLSLAPKELKAIKDGATLSPVEKDSMLLAISKWIVELGELDATFRRGDIARLKAAITTEEDSIRKPYAYDRNDYIRRTVFCASVNEREFLVDETGNRRFWVIECGKIDHLHSVDMQQLWAEVKELYRMGEVWYLTPEEENSLNAHNKDFKTIDPYREKILQKLNWDADKSLWKLLSATQILNILEIKTPNKHDCKRIASIMRELLHKGEIKLLDGYRLYLIPPERAQTLW